MRSRLTVASLTEYLRLNSPTVAPSFCSMKATIFCRRSMSNISLLPPPKLDRNQPTNHPSIRPHNVTCEHIRQSFEQYQAPRIHKHAQSVHPFEHGKNTSKIRKSGHAANSGGTPL